MVIKCTEAGTREELSPSCWGILLVLITYFSSEWWCPHNSGPGLAAGLEVELANLQYLQLVIRTVDLLVFINLKGFQELEDDRQALLQTDAVVTPEVFRIGLGVLRAAQVPRCFCEQLTAALHWYRGRK